MLSTISNIYSAVTEAWNDYSNTIESLPQQNNMPGTLPGTEGDYRLQEQDVSGASQIGQEEGFYDDNGILSSYSEDVENTNSPPPYQPTTLDNSSIYDTLLEELNTCIQESKNQVKENKRQNSLPPSYGSVIRNDEDKVSYEDAAELFNRAEIEAEEDAFPSKGVKELFDRAEIDLFITQLENNNGDYRFLESWSEQKISSLLEHIKNFNESVKNAGDVLLYSRGTTVQTVLEKHINSKNINLDQCQNNVYQTYQNSYINHQFNIINTIDNLGKEVQELNANDINKIEEVKKNLLDTQRGISAAKENTKGTHPDFQKSYQSFLNFIQSLLSKIEGLKNAGLKNIHALI